MLWGNNTVSIALLLLLFAFAVGQTLRSYGKAEDQRLRRQILLQLVLSAVLLCSFLVAMWLMR